MAQKITKPTPQKQNKTTPPLTEIPTYAFYLYMFAVPVYSLSGHARRNPASYRITWPPFTDDTEKNINKSRLVSVGLQACQVLRIRRRIFYMVALLRFKYLGRRKLTRVTM